MKILDRTGLAIFSTIVLIISIVMCMIIFDWVSINTVTGIVSRTLNYGVGSKIVFVSTDLTVNKFNKKLSSYCLNDKINFTFRASSISFFPL